MEYTVQTAQKIDDFSFLIKNIVVAHRCTYNLQSIYDCPKGRKAHGLVHILSGALEYRFYDGRTLHVKAGDTFLLKPDDKYVVTCPSVCEHYTVNFLLSRSSIDGDIARKVFMEKQTTLLKKEDWSGYQLNTFEEIASVWAEKGAGYRVRAIADLYGLLHNFIAKQIPLKQSRLHEKLAPAKEYLETHWNEEISLIKLASVCHLSVPHFRHLFLRVFKTPPMQYRDSLRLLYAKDYLLREGYTVSEIADKCGFADQNYFSRFFKKHTGLSPSEYRSQSYLPRT